MTLGYFLCAHFCIIVVKYFSWFSFKLLISCNCSPGMNTNKFLAYMWTELKKWSEWMIRYIDYQEMGIFVGGWSQKWRLCFLRNVLAVEDL